MLVCHKKLKSGEIKTYTYNKAGGVPFNQYINEREKVQRKQKRIESGKVPYVLAQFVPANTLNRNLVNTYSTNRADINIPSRLSDLYSSIFF